MPTLARALLQQQQQPAKFAKRPQQCQAQELPRRHVSRPASAGPAPSTGPGRYSRRCPFVGKGLGSAGSSRSLCQGMDSTGKPLAVLV